MTPRRFELTVGGDDLDPVPEITQPPVFAGFQGIVFANFEMMKNLVPQGSARRETEAQSSGPKYPRISMT
jgi:hypothetical protein